jgi:hypothetical protein
VTRINRISIGQGRISGWVRYRSVRPEGSLDPSSSLSYLSVLVNEIAGRSLVLYARSKASARDSTLAKLRRRRSEYAAQLRKERHPRPGKKQIRLGQLDVSKRLLTPESFAARGLEIAMAAGLQPVTDSLRRRMNSQVRKLNYPACWPSPPLTIWPGKFPETGGGAGSGAG